LEKIIMRIALFSDDYLPASTLIHAKMLHELAIRLISLGHVVIVVTPFFEHSTQKIQIDSIDGVEIWRFRSGKTRGVNKIARAVNEFSFSYKAWSSIKHKVIKNPFDLCINYSPTIFFGPLINKIKSNNSECFSYLILRDMFPQWIIDEGMISNNSPIASFFRYFERVNYRSSNVIGLMSEANIRYFKELHPQFTNIQVLRNWADTVPLGNDSCLTGFKEKYQLGDKVVFFYGGNIGHAQNMENLLRLAKRLKEFPKAHFFFVGQGDEVELLLQRKQDWTLENITYIPSVPQAEFKQLLIEADIGLFSLSVTHKAHNFPGKLLGYMVESKPILGSVNPGNDLLDLINQDQSGYAFVNGQDDELFEAALKLLEDKEDRLLKGDNAYKSLLKHFSVESAADQIIFEAEKALMLK